ncbi:LytR/AlgR family response regulator transcription factor [Eubacterium barkeri]|uniref:Stage 0 sporulation protein A homolog n=1 Tax=Eubacterium barkeri TaxID=1528 RepID=A0A1H3GTC0_EUBBA|nr:LytTR family DNA-binding domain-containing protein [Eubacterium barkeri]SDY06290.1 DNA-binding response regulator, LytR/AlgR family [Eubacterium barkeri]
MYRIALCDDKPAELNKVGALLDEYKKNHRDCEFTIHCFTSVADLKENFGKEEPFDVLLMDIYMPRENGIQGAKALRAQGFSGSIVFLTTSLEHSLQAFDVDAEQYLVKPIDQKRFFKVLEKVFARLDDEPQGTLVLQTNAGMQRIAIRDILYCEVQRHYVHINRFEGDTLSIRRTLTAFQEELKPFPDFVRVGRAYLINLGHITRLTAKAAVLTGGKTIWLPRGAYAGLKKQYFQFFREG